MTYMQEMDKNVERVRKGRTYWTNNGEAQNTFNKLRDLVRGGSWNYTEKMVISLASYRKFLVRYNKGEFEARPLIEVLEMAARYEMDLTEKIRDEYDKYLDMTTGYKGVA
jgi:hypothetical protein